MKKFFSFLSTPRDRGIGTGTLAVERRTTPPINSIYGQRYNVRHDLPATKPGLMKFFQNVPIVPIEGNGSFMQGQMALQTLTDAERDGGS